MNNHQVNLDRIVRVFKALGSLGHEVVFVGGATVALYATDPAAEEVRPTTDVDIVVETNTYAEYAALETRLRANGFSNDMDSGVICRYILHGLVVDVMPLAENILGFSNRWYPEGFKSAISCSIREDITIRIFTVPYFIASKLEAFAERSEGDGRTSQDFEDIVYVLNNRVEIWEEFSEAPVNVRAYLRQKFAGLLDNPHIAEWMSGHLEYPFADEQASRILKQMRIFVSVTYREL